MRRSALLATAAALALPAAPLAAQEATVTVAMHYTPEQAAPLLACLDEWSAATEGAAAEYQQITYRDYLQTVLTGRLAGQSPDVYNLYSIWGAQMVDNGVLAPVPDELAAWVGEHYAAGTVDAATLDGTLYGVPTEVSVYLLVSNMALLEAAGFSEPPATWDELRTIAEAITTRNDQGRVETAGFAFAVSPTGAGVVHPFYALLFSEGEDVYADGFAEANLESEAAVRVVERMAGLTRDGITDRAVDAYDFPAGGVGMMVMANWYESAIREGLGDGFDQVRVSAIPADGDWRTLQYAFYMGVDSQSDVPEESWALIRYLNSDESADESGVSCMGRMLDGLGALTANSMDNEALPEPDAFTKPFVDALAEDRAITQPNVMQASEIERAMAAAIDRVLAGEVSAEEGMSQLDAEVEDILFEFY